MTWTETCSAHELETVEHSWNAKIARAPGTIRAHQRDKETHKDHKPDSTFTSEQSTHKELAVARTEPLPGIPVPFNQNPDTNTSQTFTAANRRPGTERLAATETT